MVADFAETILLKSSFFMAYAVMTADEAAAHQPKVVFPDEHNQLPA